jgi:nucleotide-binding universal stress UspA family protein
MGIIVVGIDGSPNSDAALRWALAQARLTASRLRVVHVYPDPPALLVDGSMGIGGMPAPSVTAGDNEQFRQAAEDRAGGLIDEALRRVEGKQEGVEIEASPQPGRAAGTLIQSAQGADLLVVGSRGHGGFLGLLLGSVSQQCAQHPPCPLVIVPLEDAAPDDLQPAHPGSTQA